MSRPGVPRGRLSRVEVQAAIDAAAAAGAAARDAAIAAQTDRWISGRYYDLKWQEGGEGATGILLAANTLYANKIYIPPTTPIDRIGGNIPTTPAAAGKLIRYGLYTQLPTGLPGDLIVDSGSLAADVAAAPQATIAISPAGGWYWEVTVSDGAPTVTGYAVTRSPVRIGWTALTSTTPETGLHKSFAYGPLPASFGAPTAYNSVLLRVGLRAA